MPKRGDKVDGRYELTAPLDDRGLGECWRARDGRVKNRTVMVRLLRTLPGGATSLPPALASWASELRQLRHPSILTTHEVGLWQGAPFLIQDLFEGPTLGAGLDKARGAGAVLSVTTIDLFFDRVLTAVEVAHLQAVPITHGAIGPGSVFIQRLPGASFDVRVTDFGLLPWTAAPVTREGSTRGLMWAAPERALTEAPTKAVDVYQLGRLLELMLTSPTSADGFHDEAPRALADVIARATHDDPARRFETVRDLRDAFRRAFEKRAPVEPAAPAVRASTMVAPMPERRVVHAQTHAAPMPERPAPVVAPVRAGTQAAPMPERTSISEAPVHVPTPASAPVRAAPVATAELAVFAMEGPRWGSPVVHTAFMLRQPEVAKPPPTVELSAFPQGFGGDASGQLYAATQVAFRDGPPVVPQLEAPPIEPMTAVVEQGGALAIARFGDGMNPWDAQELLPFHEGLAAAASEYVPTTVHAPPPLAMPPGALAAPTNARAAPDDRAVIVKTAVYGVLIGVVLLLIGVGAFLAMR